MRRLSFAAATAIVAVCAVLFLMNGNAASAYERMQLAVSHVKSAHMIVWYNTAKTGPVVIQKEEEVWYQNDCWRKRYGDGSSGDRIIRGTTYYAYDSGQRRVISARETATQPRLAEFSLTALAGDYMPTGANPHPRLLGSSVENGRRIEEIDLDLSDQGERMLFWVDDSTGLPIRAQKQDKDEATGRWVVNGRFEFDFNRTLPEWLFDPRSLAPKS